MPISFDPKDDAAEGQTFSIQELPAFHQAIVSGLGRPWTQATKPEEAERRLRRIRPLCHRARITRLADLTGLDRIGLPVVQAIRPAALSEVTSLGRGMFIAEAAVGAIMEALERYYAEAIPPEWTFPATAEELEVPDGLFEALLLPSYREKWQRHVIPWIMGVDIVTGRPQPVPLELVHTCYTEPPPPGDGLFVRTTTGLACHMDACSAFLHGLFECIERDAIARAFVTHGFFDRMRIPPTGLGSRVDHIRSAAAALGISCALWHAPSPTGVPVVWCQTIETGPGEPILALPTEGYGAGPSLEAAAANAMLEALSARAGAISGARDDQTRVHYRRSVDAAVAKARVLILDEQFGRPVRVPASPAIADPATLVSVVGSSGLGPIIAVPLGYDRDTNVHCVRTVLAGAHALFVLR
ncbi:MULTISPECIES: YcaO-like family protein [Sinorhizobium]|uniref:YcaO-like family protein n=1 Tax=Sinorhizobium TaxID=28105 RepID=UPI001F1D05EC|nr:MULTISPECIES: YcaO-like family protein [Sinorhizobium]